jgi:hypothetical protein
MPSVTDRLFRIISLSSNKKMSPTYTAVDTQVD